MVLNELVEKKLIDQYAIGGGIAAVFYIEPILTYDLDVFIIQKEGPPLEPLAEIYRFLKDRGYREMDEQILIEGIPVQLLPAFNPLLEEAVLEANAIAYEGTPARVIGVEHLLAIMLQTGRPKDRERFIQVMQEAEIDRSRLDTVLTRYSLSGKFADWEPLLRKE